MFSSALAEVAENDSKPLAKPSAMLLLIVTTEPWNANNPVCAVVPSIRIRSSEATAVPEEGCTKIADPARVMQSLITRVPGPLNATLDENPWKKPFITQF